MTKLAVASCANLQRVNPQPVWSRLRAERPDGVLLIGDTVYLDDDRHVEPAALSSDLRRRLEAQLAEPNFAGMLADLREREAALLAIYDDHDFLGDNRYGGDFDPALREAARLEYQRALTPHRVGQEAYVRHEFGLVDVVLLDVRFHRSTPKKSKDDADAVLGAAQWEWFTGCVTRSRAPFVLVAQSTTFHAFAGESWEEYPAAFERMRGLLRGRKGALVISGDVHRNALYDDSGVIEVVTSGVAGRGAVFDVCRENYGILTFEPDALRVELRSLKVHGRFDVRIPLSAWTLP